MSGLDEYVLPTGTMVITDSHGVTLWHQSQPIHIRLKIQDAEELAHILGMWLRETVDGTDQS